MTNDELKELIQKIEELNKLQISTQNKINESITNLGKIYTDSVNHILKAKNGEYNIKIFLSFIFSTILGIWGLDLSWYLGISLGIVIPVTFIKH